MSGTSVELDHTAATNDNRRTIATITIAALAVLAALYIGRQFLVPIALALFLNTVIRPVIRHMEKTRVPAALSAAVVVIAILTALGTAGVLLAHPTQRWVAHAPESLKAAQKRARDLWKPMARLTSAAADLSRSTSAPTDSGKAIIVAAEPTGLHIDFFGTSAVLVAGSVEVILLVWLLLAGGGMFLQRLLSVIPARADKRTAAQIASEVETAVSHYLVATTMINIGQGIVVGIVLQLLGMPDAPLWGALTILLEFIPYAGGAVLVAVLSVSALSAFPSLGHAALIPLAYLVISVLQNYVVSPMFYGNRLKLNAVAVLIAVLFWGYLWGVVGAFLAVPILATIRILCDHVEALDPLGKFLKA